MQDFCERGPRAEFRAAAATISAVRGDEAVLASRSRRLLGTDEISREIMTHRCVVLTLFVELIARLGAFRPHQGIYVLQVVVIYD